ncbi:hypothetical protein RRG08_028875 [Elysia crispata]|uniref:Uncharacterized protein n=1 Tax=Elysia crispata TaxID=231223 RepID=A0AAE0YZA8_9GAST|nr:hypothetical protein RRG08_028875 [Elysia crispata]
MPYKYAAFSLPKNRSGVDCSNWLSVSNQTVPHVSVVSDTAPARSEISEPGRWLAPTHRVSDTCRYYRLLTQYRAIPSPGSEYDGIVIPLIVVCSSNLLKFRVIKDQIE